MKPRPICTILLMLLLGGCTITGGGPEGDRFQRTGFPGIFEPGAAVIVDTVTGEVYVIGGGSLADGAIASALRRPSRVTSVMSGGNANADSSADSDSASDSASDSDGGESHNHGHGHGGHDD